MAIGNKAVITQHLNNLLEMAMIGINLKKLSQINTASS